MIKLVLNILLTFVAIIVAIFVFIFANNPDLLDKKASKLINKPLYKVGVYQDSQGNPKYGFGFCKQNSDCTPAGCSKQVCSSDKNLTTTCEIVNDFPDPLVYSCGCAEERCVWYKPR